MGCEEGIIFGLGDFDEELMLVGAHIYRTKLRWDFKTVIKTLISQAYNNFQPNFL